jgi:hypothetical protein
VHQTPRDAAAKTGIGVSTAVLADAVQSIVVRRRNMGLGCRALRRRIVVILSGNRNVKQKQVDIAGNSDENSYLPSCTVEKS